MFGLCTRNQQGGWRQQQQQQQQPDATHQPQAARFVPASGRGKVCACIWPLCELHHTTILYAAKPFATEAVVCDKLVSPPQSKFKHATAVTVCSNRLKYKHHWQHGMCTGRWMHLVRCPGCTCSICSYQAASKQQQQLYTSQNHAAPAAVHTFLQRC